MSEQITKKRFNVEFNYLTTKTSIQGPCKYGYMLDSLSDDIIQELDDIYNEVINDFDSQSKYNHFLAGNIEHEFYIEFGEKFTKYIKDLSYHFEVKSDSLIKKSYINSIPMKSLIMRPNNGLISREEKINAKKYFKPYELPDLVLEGGWVNLQKKYEYNPLHNHSGLLSFVVWHKIPFLNKNESSHENVKNKIPGQGFENGAFSFYYVTGGDIMTHQLTVDKSWENTIAIFPSDLNHSVNPFYTSDEYRVTFSGNIFLKDEKSFINFYSK